MSVANIPLKYFVACTGYTDRLLEDKYLDTLEELCDDLNIDKFFIRHTYGCGTVIMNNNDDDWSQDDTVSEEYNELIERLKNNGLGSDGLIVFEVDTFNTASKLLCGKLKELDYCAMYDIDDIKLLQNSDGVIDTLYASFDTESG